MASKTYYKASWETNEIIIKEGSSGADSIDLSNAPEGNLSVTIYALGVGYIKTGEDYRKENDLVWSYNYYDRFEMTGYSTVSFIKDLSPPKILFYHLKIEPTPRQILNCILPLVRLPLSSNIV